MIRMSYTSGGITQEYEFADDRLDEILARADAKFLPPLTRDDELRFQEILKRRYGKKRSEK